MRLDNGLVSVRQQTTMCASADLLSTGTVTSFREIGIKLRYFFQVKAFGDDVSKMSAILVHALMCKWYVCSSPNL